VSRWCTFLWVEAVLRWGVIEEERDDDVAGDKDGRWRCACVYDCVKRERRVVSPEPVND